MLKKSKNKLIRQFLLRSLKNKSKQIEIENKLIFDLAFSQRVMMAEDELIEDYIDDDLTSAEKKTFNKNFLVSVERRTNLKFLFFLIKYARKVKANFRQDGEEELFIDGE